MLRWTLEPVPRHNEREPPGGYPGGSRRGSAPQELNQANQDSDGGCERANNLAPRRGSALFSILPCRMPKTVTHTPFTSFRWIDTLLNQAGKCQGRPTVEGLPTMPQPSDIAPVAQEPVRTTSGNGGASGVNTPGG